MLCGLIKFSLFFLFKARIKLGTNVFVKFQMSCDNRNIKNVSQTIKLPINLTLLKIIFLQYTAFSQDFQDWLTLTLRKNSAIIISSTIIFFNSYHLWNIQLLTYDIADSGIGGHTYTFSCYLLTWILEVKSHHAMKLQILNVKYLTQLRMVIKIWRNISSLLYFME